MKHTRINNTFLYIKKETRSEFTYMNRSTGIAVFTVPALSDSCSKQRKN